MGKFKEKKEEEKNSECHGCKRLVWRLFGRNSKFFEDSHTVERLCCFFNLSEDEFPEELLLCGGCVNSVSSVARILENWDVDSASSDDSEVMAADRDNIFIFRTPTKVPSRKRDASSTPTPRKSYPAKKSLQEDLNYSSRFQGSMPLRMTANPEKSGLYFNENYNDSESQALTEADRGKLQGALTQGTVGAVTKAVQTVPKLQAYLRKNFLEVLEREVASVIPTSVLSTSDIESLEDGGLPEKCFKELVTRCPVLLDVLVTTMCGPHPPDTSRLLAPLATVYAMLLHLRNRQLTAYHRMMTLILARGGITERCLTIQCSLGLSQSYRNKLRLEQLCAERQRRKLLEKLNTGELVSIAGDNFDIRITPRYQSSERQPLDCHYYTSLVYCSRLSNEIKALQQAEPTATELTEPPSAESYLPSQEEGEEILAGYKVMLARVLSVKLPALAFMRDVYPARIPHQYSDTYKQETEVFPLELMFHDEKKLEDVVTILDETTEQIRDYVVKLLELTGFTTIVYVGDQLTRVRVDKALMLRILSPDSLKRLSHFGPVITALWHVKQNFVQKAYDHLYNETDGRDVTTLYHAKLACQKKNVNGEVKQNFRSHEQHLLFMTEFLMAEQAMERLGMTKYEDVPTNLVGAEHLPKAEQLALADGILDDILTFFEYGQYRLARSAINPPHAADSKRKPRQDDIMANSTSLVHWGVHLMFMNDTVKEADLERTVLGMKMYIPFFFSHSTASKYLIECVDFLLKTTLVGTKAERLRLLDACYMTVNGTSREADLVQENQVKSRKEAVRSLGSNKDEKNILRVTGASDTMASLSDNVSAALGIRPSHGKHSEPVSEKDDELLRKYFRKIRPFQFKSGRRLKSRKTVQPSPFLRTDYDSLTARVAEISERRSLPFMKVEEDEVREP